ncbi:MAG: galactitol-1-phosphate 5-dehydrogenase [Eubacteriales bacterium]
MKAARFYGIRDVRVEDVPVSEIISQDEVLIKVKVAGICGSDISKYYKTGPRQTGDIIGHEFSGEVAETGSLSTEFKIGDPVVVCPALPCFKCGQCEQGEYSRCEDLGVLGSKGEGGGFAEYVKVNKKNVLKLPQGIDYETAAAIEPSCVAARGLYKSGIKVGDTVVVVGAGPIGLFSIQWAKIFGGTKIIAVDIFDEKLELAKRVGADICINSRTEDLQSRIDMLTNNKGVDLAIESAGTPKTCAQIIELPKKGGKILYAGVPYGNVLMSSHEFEKILRYELTVKGTWFGSSSPFPGKEWKSTIHYMKEGKILVTPFITHRISLNELPLTLEKVYKRDIFFSKIMIEMN